MSLYPASSFRVGGKRQYNICIEEGILIIEDQLHKLQTSFEKGTTRSLAWRKTQLRQLREMIEQCTEEIHEALKKDLGKPALEAKVSETGYVKGEIKYALKHLKKWAKPARVRIPFTLRPGKAYIEPEPYGVALIMGPWNFPFQLLATPLVSALAAGNCAVLKPSEIAPNTSAVFAQRIPEYLDTDAVAVVEGDAETAKALLSQRYDYIFYTGNSNIGREVMAAAAKELTPVTLELGGKCPCIVDATADLEVAARRIVWGKFLNAGQTCVAPDYVLVEKACEAKLLEHISNTVHTFYGADPKQSPDYGRIVNTRHFDRVAKLLTSGETLVGGESDREALYISPTVLHDVDPASPVMQEEIFGPILPVLSVENITDAVDFVRSRPKSLALYLFTSSKINRGRIVGNCSSGGVCINDTILQLSVPQLPFGGVGESGIGQYHGKAGFETFTHARTVLDHGTWLDPKFRYPPYA